MGNLRRREPAWQDSVRAARKAANDIPQNWAIRTALEGCCYELERLLNGIASARRSGVPPSILERFTEESNAALKSIYRIAFRASHVAQLGLPEGEFSAKLDVQSQKIESLRAAAYRSRSVLANLSLSTEDSKDAEKAAEGLAALAHASKVLDVEASSTALPPVPGAKLTKSSSAKMFPILAVLGLVLISGSIALFVWPRILGAGLPQEPLVDQDPVGGQPEPISATAVAEPNSSPSTEVATDKSVSAHQTATVEAILMLATTVSAQQAEDAATKAVEVTQVALNQEATQFAQGLQTQQVSETGTASAQLSEMQTATAEAALDEQIGRIAFVTSRDGNEEVYTMKPNGTGLLRLTNSEAGDAAPTWSPDNQQIAFMSNRDGNWNIYVMNKDGTGQRQLTSGPGNYRLPAWSPDGSYIAFNSDRLNPGVAVYAIYVMRTDGSQQTQLTYGLNAGRPAWSPDGTKIAFNVLQDGNTDNYDVYLMNADGSASTQLTNSIGDDSVPAWLPDGRIAFISDRDGNRELYLMNADGSSQTRLTNSSADEGSSTWSPDGSSTIFDAYADDQWQLYSMESNGKARVQLTYGLLDGYSPAWTKRHR